MCRLPPTGDVGSGPRWPDWDSIRYVAPVVEEPSSRLRVYLLNGNKWLRPDAAIHGFAIGTGFTFFENLYYVQRAPEATLWTWSCGIGTRSTSRNVCVRCSHGVQMPCTAHSSWSVRSASSQPCASLRETSCEVHTGHCQAGPVMQHDVFSEERKVQGHGHGRSCSGGEQ